MADASGGEMTRLRDFISTERIVPIGDTSHRHILETLVATAVDGRDQSVRDNAVTAILADRTSKELNLGNGFAVSHTRLDTLDQIRVSVGLLAQPVRHYAGDPVHTVFCILIPNAQYRPYLTFLARLTRLISTDDAGDVFSSADVDRIARMIADFDA